MHSLMHTTQKEGLAVVSSQTSSLVVLAPAGSAHMKS